MSTHTITIGDSSLDLSKIIDFAASIFGSNYQESRIVQQQVIESEPTTAPHNFVICSTMDGIIIGLVRIVEREVLLDGVSLKAGGLSTIGVHPQWRGQGIAAAMMAEAARVMRQRGLDIAFLHGRKAMDGFYTKFGYAGINRYIDLTLLAYPRADIRFSVVDLVPEAKDYCANLYERFYHPLSGSVKRYSALWDYNISRLAKGIGGLAGKLIMHADKLVGYFVTEGSTVVELAVSEEYFSSLPEFYKDQYIESFAIHPRHPFYRYCRARISSIVRDRFVVDGGYMGRILNLESVLRKMLPVFTERAGWIGRQAEKCIICGYEIDLHAGTILPTSQLDDVYIENNENLIQMILGIVAGEHIAEADFNSKKSWIAPLFPSTDFHTSKLDEI